MSIRHHRDSSGYKPARAYPNLVMQVGGRPAPGVQEEGRKIAIAYNVLAPASDAWWRADHHLHRASLRGRLATAYARGAVWLLGKLSRSDIRDPAFDWEKGRKAVHTVEGPIARLADGVRRDGASMAPVPSEWFLPKSAAADEADGPCVLYVHGGSYCLDRTRLHDALASHVALQSGLPVLAVDYRLAPEHPFPAGLEDVLATWRWLLERRAPSRIAFLGDSAGAGLALASLLRLRDAGADMPAAFVGLCPWADLTFSGASIIDNADTDAFMSDIEIISGFAELYLQGTSAFDPCASPALTELHGMPDMLVHAGSHDMLADDARRIVSSVRRNGGRARLELWTHMPHVWQRLGDMVPESRQSLEAIGSFLAARLIEMETAA